MNSPTRQFGQIFAAVALFLLAPACIGQAAAPAGVEAMRLQAFAMLSYVRPDFGGAKKNAGGTVGADLNIGSFGRFEPSLEVRAVGSGGRVSNQYAYSGGPRVEARYGPFRPYADFLIGYGIIKFNKPKPLTYTQDNSIVMTFGGGVDYALGRSWALRADIQRQSWQIDKAVPAFHPIQISGGLRYRFHFRNKNGGPE
jgi:hypothetical protein